MPINILHPTSRVLKNKQNTKEHRGTRARSRAHCFRISGTVSPSAPPQFRGYNLLIIGRRRRRTFLRAPYIYMCVYIQTHIYRQTSVARAGQLAPCTCVRIYSSVRPDACSDPLPFSLLERAGRNVLTP